MTIFLISKNDFSIIIIILIIHIIFIGSSLLLLLLLITIIVGEIQQGIWKIDDWNFVHEKLTTYLHKYESVLFVN